ncbi:hypothetical protein HGM15179_013632 [Zosterops borbonicus]|uniref:Uncharacterized protein n=1 Tax=Zosterops borbonicus TaxID=364589 RepID=A0A8K1G7M7_9PASS|nr:hypothetical protein HGM15179_013632 [Zosterops borbonicus]
MRLEVSVAPHIRILLALRGRALPGLPNLAKTNQECPTVQVLQHGQDVPRSPVFHANSRGKRALAGPG